MSRTPLAEQLLGPDNPRPMSVRLMETLKCKTDTPSPENVSDKLRPAVTSWIHRR